MAELGPDEHRGGVVEEEVGRQLLAEPRQVGGGHHQPQHAVEAGAVSPHHRVGVPPRGQQLGEVGEGAAHEGDLDDRLIDECEVVQSQRWPLLGPSPG